MDFYKWIESFIYKDQKRIDQLLNHSDYSVEFGKWLLCKTVCSNVPLSALRGAYETGFLTSYIPEFTNTHLIPQDKKFGKNLLEHSILCLSAIDAVPFVRKKMNELALWKYLSFACLLHDIGKISSFEKHDIIGADIAHDICLYLQEYLFCDNLAEIVYMMIYQHMRPLGYQRGENWSNGAVSKFVHDCGDKTIALGTVLLSICDKFASSQNHEYLERLFDLYERIENMEVNGPEESSRARQQ